MAQGWSVMLFEMERWMVPNKPGGSVMRQTINGFPVNGPNERFFQGKRVVSVQVYGL